MTTFPPDIRFRKPWRSYQQRVLSELEGHLDDNHLHIIAAPGSGKTVLGLEVVRRLDQPTLIFAPSIAIRDQWVERLIGLFSDNGPGVPDWISKDIRSPKLLTVSTYQGLHSVYTGQDEEQEAAPARGRGAKGKMRFVGRDALIARLKALRIRTLVLDEAHHLRNEWWKCLVDLKKHLGRPAVVALTATAPFDVSPSEWDRYVDLCGPIDAEICVPELVKERNLCPHQDYVYMSAPLQAEQAELRRFRRDVDDTIKSLVANEAFVQALESDPRVREPKAHLEDILADPGFYSSMAFFLNHVRGRAPRALLRIIGFPPHKCPAVNHEWLEILLSGCLYAHAKDFERHKALLGQIARDLKRIGAIERRTVNLASNRRTARLLIRSVSKLKSIEDIVRIESQSLGSDLRMVVLTDFIRKEDFPKDPTDLKPLKRLGVVPIFEQIRRSETAGVRLGILTGTLTVVPSDAREQLSTVAVELGLDARRLTCKPLAHDERFCEVTLGGADKQQMVTLITRLFQHGAVNVLVGTTSLLGEGWDAPSVNALILASFVGSYMLSNQMRGRAIRTQEGNPTKTANIWHLVCQEAGTTVVGEDFETLTRRFRSFVGVSFATLTIESGLARLGIGSPPFDETRIEQINAMMVQYAKDRDALRTRWEQALASAGVGLMLEEVTTSPPTLPRDFVFSRTILALLWQGWFWGVAVFAGVMRSAEGVSGGMPASTLMLLLAVASAAAAVAALPSCAKALWLLLRHGRVASSMRQVGKALLASLAQVEAIKTRPAHIRIIAQDRAYGLVSCTLKGATTRERSVFLEALQELLAPVDNPRYILVRKTRLGSLVRRDYHAVPKLLARNKESAEHFARMWTRYVGPCELIYTRNVEGRQQLLKARAQSLSAAFQHHTERTRAWR